MLWYKYIRDWATVRYTQKQTFKLLWNATILVNSLCNKYIKKGVCLESITAHALGNNKSILNYRNNFNDGKKYQVIPLFIIKVPFHFSWQISTRQHQKTLTLKILKNKSPTNTLHNALRITISFKKKLTKTQVSVD